MGAERGGTTRKGRRGGGRVGVAEEGEAWRRRGRRGGGGGVGSGEEGKVTRRVWA